MLKTRLYLFLSFIFIFGQSFGTQDNLKDSHTLYVNALASVDYFLRISSSNLNDEENNFFKFDSEKLENLWDRIKANSPDQFSAHYAYSQFCTAQKLKEENNILEAVEAYESSHKVVENLWDASLEIYDTKEPSFDLCLTASKEKDEKRKILNNYPHLTEEMKHVIAPYLISNSHCMKSVLDDLFRKERVTANRRVFKDHGFKILFQQPRSYIVVARHPLLKKNLKDEFLIKCYFDTEKRQKWGKPSWQWLAQRCMGAERIAKIIKSKKIKYFMVPEKNLYVLPLLEKKPPYSSCYTRHPILLLATYLDLVSKDENKRAWLEIMDEKRLDELYCIITHCKGRSWRRANIPYSKSKKFCFCDTEYNTDKVEFYRIGRELNAEMADYWNHLVTHGGNSSSSRSSSSSR